MSFFFPSIYLYNLSQIHLLLYFFHPDIIKYQNIISHLLLFYLLYTLYLYHKHFINSALCIHYLSHIMSDIHKNYPTIYPTLIHSLFSYPLLTF